MSTEQRVRAMRRSARNSFYRMREEGLYNPRITNWRMLIAMRLKISITEVRRMLGERKEGEENERS